MEYIAEQHLAETRRHNRVVEALLERVAVSHEEIVTELRRRNDLLEQNQN